MYGDIKITLVKSETLAEYAVRTFALERVWTCSCPHGENRPPRPSLPITRLAFTKTRFITLTWGFHPWLRCNF